MARLARTIVPGVAHHVTQRGNNRQDVFFAADDRRAYLELLAEKCEMHGLAVARARRTSEHRDAENLE